MSTLVQQTLDGGVCRICLNRPDKRNALTREFIEQICLALETLADDDTVRVLVLESAGTVFCAGMDLGEMQQRAASPNSQAEWLEDSRVYGRMLRAIFALPFPTIAAVQGPAVAGGMGMVLACDMVIACETAFFALPEPARGLTAAMVTPLLIHRVGYGAARFLLLSGQRCPATFARSLGICHDVVPLASLTTRVNELIASVLSGSREALRITKEHVAQCTSVDVLAQLEQSTEVSAMARETEDAREGLAAFLEKRKPNWVGR